MQKYMVSLNSSLSDISLSRELSQKNAVQCFLKYLVVSEMITKSHSLWRSDGGPIHYYHSKKLINIKYMADRQGPDSKE